MDKNFPLRFAGYWTVNTLILSLANSFFPGAFELGNASLTAPLAAVFSSFLLTNFLFLVRGWARTKNLLAKGRFTMFAYYWGASASGVWFLARIADISGFGITGYSWAIGVGFVISLTDWLFRQAFKGMKML